MLTRYLLALTILLSPTYIVRRNICCLPLLGDYPTNLLELLILTTFGLYLVDKIKNKNFKFKILNLKLFLTIGLFLVAAGISVLVSPDKSGGLGIFKAYFVEPILVFFILIDIVKTRKDWWLLFNSFLLSGLWIAILAVFQFVTGNFNFASHEAVQGRAHAVYNTANAVGLYLGPIFALSLGIFLNSLLIKFKSQKSKVKSTSQKLKVIIFGVSTLLYLLAIVFSKSRGAMIGLIFIILLSLTNFFISLYPYIFIFKIIKRYGTLILSVFIGVFLGFSVWFFINIAQYTPRVENPWIRPAGTGTVRLCVWEGTRNLLKEHFIFGAGLSGFKELYSKNYITCDAEPLEYPHNIILNFWTETGLLGLLGICLIVIFYFRNLALSSTLRDEPSPSDSNESKVEGLKFAFAGAMVYWLVHGFVDVPYFKNDLSVQFWVLVGLLLTRF